MTTRPNNFPDWATGNPTGIVQPSSADQATGWVPSEPPPAQYANWLANTTSQWLRYLDERGSGTVLASSLDFSTRLLTTGTFALSGTTLSWSAPLLLAIPSAFDQQNAINTGSVNIPNGSIAYVTANMPFSTTATTTAGTNTLTGVLYGDQAVVGQTATGTGLAANAVVKSISADGQTITLSGNSTASASGVTVTFSSSGVLTPQVAVSSSFVPGPNTVVFARSVANGVIVGVGSGQMLVRPAETKILLGHGFGTTRTLTAGVAIAANQAVYLSPGSTDGGRTAGYVYPMDCTSTSNVIRATFLGFTTAAVAANGSVLVVMNGTLAGFTGLVPGAQYWGHGDTPGAIYPATAPYRAGQWSSNVGVAISQTEMLVLAGTPPSQYAANAYKAVLDMGYILPSSVSGSGGAGSLGPTRFFSRDVNNNTIDTPFARPMPFAGSVLSISPRTYFFYAGSTGPTAATSTVAYTLQKNGATLCSFTNSDDGNSPYAEGVFAKGAYPFAAGDVLKLTTTISGLTTSLYGLKFVDIGVEFTP